MAFMRMAVYYSMIEPISNLGILIAYDQKQAAKIFTLRCFSRRPLCRRLPNVVNRKRENFMGTDEVMRKTLELARAQLANYKTQAVEAQKRAQQQVTIKAQSKATQSNQRKVQAA